MQIKKPYHFQMAVKAVEDSDGGVTIEGFASTPDIDRYRDIVEPSAFEAALKMYMKNPVLLRSHDADRPVGKVIQATVTEKGLKVTAEVMDDQTKGEILDERMRAMSIGYIPQVTELMIEDESGQLRAFNWEEDSAWDPKVVRVIKKLDLVEISIVSTPANGNALFTIQKSLHKALNEVVCKAFNLNPESKDSMNIKKKSDEQVSEEEKKDDAVEVTDEEKVEETTEETVEETTEDHTCTDDCDEDCEMKADTEEEAAEGTDEESNETEESDDSEPEEAGNSDETSEADDAEGTESAEEADADAEPEEGTEEATVTEDEEKDVTLNVTAEIAAKMPILQGVGAVKIAQEGKEMTLPKEAVEILELADSALAAAQKHIEGLEEKLDNYAEKQAFIHGQLDGDGDDAEAKKVAMNSKKDASKSFKMLFGLN